MKAVIHYYDGNDYHAKLVEFKGSAGPFGLDDFDLPTLWKVETGFVQIQSVVEVPEDTTIAFVHLDNNGYLVIFASEVGEDYVTLNLEVLELI